MEAKRGQLTLFVIIGVVILIGLGVFLYARSASVPKEEAVPADVAPIKVYVEQCLKSTAEDAVLYVALHGGYYQLPEKSAMFAGFNEDPAAPVDIIQMPYYFYNGEESIPTKEEIEDQLSFYISSGITSCDMSSFEEKGYKIELGEPIVKSTIGAKNIIFDTTYPITIWIGENKEVISEFSDDVDVNIMKLYDISKQYIQYQKKDPAVFFISRLMRLSSDNGIFSSVLNDINGDIVVELKDNSTLIKNQPLVFGFAINFLPEEAINQTG